MSGLRDSGVTETHGRTDTWPDAQILPESPAANPRLQRAVAGILSISGRNHRVGAGFPSPANARLAGGGAVGGRGTVPLADRGNCHDMPSGACGRM